MDDIFCKIINKEIPAKIEYEDDICIIIHDINPKAKHHLLLIPKKHIRSIADLKDEESSIISHLILKARDIAKEKGLEGYKLVFNVDEKGGQEVFHVHLHLLSNSD